MPSFEIEHLSDRAFHISGQTLEELFLQAVSVMYSLMKIKAAGPRIGRQVSFQAEDTESLLVMVLSELISIAELETLAANEIGFFINGNSLRADLSLSSIIEKHDYIKAATFSELNILKTETGFETNLVFDI